MSADALSHAAGQYLKVFGKQPAAPMKMGLTLLDAYE
jgi:hypothetical protein